MNVAGSGFACGGALEVPWGRYSPDIRLEFRGNYSKSGNDSGLLVVGTRIPSDSHIRMIHPDPDRLLGVHMIPCTFAEVFVDVVGYGHA
jgi:hypothetical protein